MRRIAESELVKVTPYRNDEIRESVHFDFAPCTATEFLAEYLKRDPEFESTAVALIGGLE